jgi:hypothetical protein
MPSSNPCDTSANRTRARCKGVSPRPGLLGACSLVAVLFRQRPVVCSWGRALWLAALFASPFAAAQSHAGSACPVQPEYPLPRGAAELRELADRLEFFSQQAGCLQSADFHAWRGAVLLMLGRPVEAVEPLERALLTNPQLFGAQLDLAQAHAMQGDRASAAALLQDLRDRAEVPSGFSLRLQQEIAALQAPARAVAEPAPGGWQSSWQFSAVAGGDTNLNNAPSATEITLTLPAGDVTLPLDPASRPRKGAALLAAAQWQAIRSQGESVWMLQADMRARKTADSGTGYSRPTSLPTGCRRRWRPRNGWPASVPAISSSAAPRSCGPPGRASSTNGPGFPPPSSACR